MTGPLGIPWPLLTDSYKATHFELYPEEAQQLTAYGEFRSPYEKDSLDHRVLFYGMRYIVENYIAVRWTQEDVTLAEAYFAHHNAGGTQFPFPKQAFQRIVNELDGYFPVRIEALPEGSTVYPHVPVFQITAEKEFASLVTYLETLLTMVWYPATVATLSRRCKDYIEASYERTVDPEGMWSLDSRLHDFGFRGCTCVEQSVIGGCAHLINFNGTDTMSAGFYAQYKLNNGAPVGFSIPATEHSIMTAHSTETKALSRLLEKYGSGVCACVMDSYDYAVALEKVLPSLAKLKLEKGGFLVLRPDSGDPVEVVLMALRAADKVFGSDVNGKGFKVIRGAGVIQGDGISHTTINTILSAVKSAGYSAQSVAFGMGGGLLQKVNRDTMSFATKLNKIVYADGRVRNVMKMPKTGKEKFSLPGELSVHANEQGLPVVYPSDQAPTSTSNLLQVVYDHGKVPEWDSFSKVRERASKTWTSSPKHFQPISPAMQARIDETMAAQTAANQAQLEALNSSSSSS